jgi:hypothetical protein
MIAKPLLVVAVTMAACSALAFDDSSSNGMRAVEGIVTGADSRPVSGAVVQLNDTKTLQIRSFITKADGAYHFAGLSTNDDYEVRAQLNGVHSGTKRLDVFNPRKLAKINLKLKK